MMTGDLALLRVTALFLFTGMVSCKKEAVPEPSSPAPHAVTLRVPGNFPAATDDPDNPLTEEGIELGRILFYDARLSGNNRLSCASCHRQELAFSDGLDLSTAGSSGNKLLRHAPALFNLAWSKNGFFWDGGSKNLESQAFGPLTSTDEMHQDLYVLEAELNALPDYRARFRQAFNGEVTSANIVKALAQFERTLVSGNSRYDRYRRKENDGQLSPIELSGRTLVADKCQSCHSGELFTDNAFHNNGLDDTFSDAEDRIFMGRFRVTNDPADLGRYKTPSLRNVLLTAPYMHDGRLKTIDQVLDHYARHVKPAPTTDPLLMPANRPTGIPLSTDERKAIIAFLATLTDSLFITDPKISPTP